jgi:ABC-type branched-subunit amino acid transport system substrate-binding protein
MRKRMIKWMAVCAVLALGAAACASGDDDDASDGGSDGGSGCEVVFGANTQLSGDLQVFGLPSQVAIEAAERDINADGGVQVGDEQCDFRAVVVDNRSDPTVVASATQEVLDADPVAAQGPDINAPVAYEPWNEAGVITFTPAFDLQSQLQAGPDDSPLLFTPLPFFSELYRNQMAQVLAEAPDIARVAIIAPNSDVGQGAGASWEDAATANGVEVVSAEYFPVGTTDFASIVTTAGAQDPDVIIALQSPEEALAIMQEIATQEAAPYVMNDAISADFVRGQEQFADLTVIIPSFGPTFSPTVVIPDYDPEAIFGDETDPLTPAATVVIYYSARILADAVSEVGSTDDPSAIAEAMIGRSYDGPFGTCMMTDRHSLECETNLIIAHGDDVEVFRFAKPEDTTPSAAYLCDPDCAEV